VADIVVPTCAPGSQLGTGFDVKVLLITRGGESIIGELKPVGGYFTRDLDATSNLELTGVTTGLLGESCCDIWQDVYPWRTEIIVYRDGRDAWSGPVTGVEFGYGTVKVTASDLSAWWDRRVLSKDLTFTNVDLADIFTDLHDAAMAIDPVPNFSVAATPTGIIGSRNYMASDYKYVKDLIAELSKTGIDWTAYGRTMLVGGEEVPAQPYVMITDEFWTQPPSVFARGNEQATEVIVKGKGVTGMALSSPAYLNYYGRLTRVFDENQIEDQESANAAARTRLALLEDQLYVETPSNASLKPTAPITVAELVPGIRVRVDTKASCRRVVADFRLKSVRVDLNGDVSIALQPLGTVGSL
jgi:hypothetical protein